MGVRSLVTEPATRGGHAVSARIRSIPTRAKRAYAGARERLPADQRVVALSFDDGPHPDFTPRVLDILASFDVRATFFLVGYRVEQHPDLVLRMQQEGHVLGSHSYSHPDALSLPLRHLQHDYAAGRAALEAVVGRSVTLFRPPNGSLDIKGAVVMRRLGLVPWLWNVDPSDWHPDTTEDQVVARCSPAGERDVVLMHDALERPWAPRALDRGPTVRALPRVIEALHERNVPTGTVRAC